MKGVKDKTGLFGDFHFKLLVIDALLTNEPSFEKELTKMEKKYVTPYEWDMDLGPIKEMVNFFQELEFTKEDLEKVEELYFDMENEVYTLIWPDWDGEDGTFDVRSAEGLENLPSLKRVYDYGLARPEVLETLRQSGIAIETE